MSTKKLVYPVAFRLQMAIPSKIPNNSEIVILNKGVGKREGGNKTHTGYFGSVIWLGFVNDLPSGVRQTSGYDAWVLAFSVF